MEGSLLGERSERKGDLQGRLDWGAFEVLTLCGKENTRDFVGPDVPNVFAPKKCLLILPNFCVISIETFGAQEGDASL